MALLLPVSAGTAPSRAGLLWPHTLRCSQVLPAQRPHSSSLDLRELRFIYPFPLQGAPRGPGPVLSRPPRVLSSQHSARLTVLTQGTFLMHQHSRDGELASTLQRRAVGPDPMCGVLKVTEFVGDAGTRILSSCLLDRFLSSDHWMQRWSWSC